MKKLVLNKELVAKLSDQELSTIIGGLAVAVDPLNPLMGIAPQVAGDSQSDNLCQPTNGGNTLYCWSKWCK